MDFEPSNTDRHEPISERPSGTANVNQPALSGDIRVVISSTCAQSEQSDTVPPPTYDEALLDPYAISPPAYDTLFGQVETARRASDGVTDFVKDLTILLFGTIGCVGCIGLAVVVPVSMIVVGSIYFKDCPQEDKIPLYLVVGGTTTLLNNMCVNTRRQRNEEVNQTNANTKKSPFKAFFTTFMLIWFILGSIWVYKEYEPSNDPASANYCNHTLYFFAFWVITSSYIILLVLSMGSCCLVCWLQVLKKLGVQRQSDSNSPAATNTTLPP